MNPTKKQQLFIITGASCVGKSTLCEQLFLKEKVLVSKWVGKVIWPVDHILSRPCCCGSNRCLSPSTPHLSAV